MAVPTIRVRLLLVFAAFALLAVGGMALAAVRIVRARAEEQAQLDFRLAGEQLRRSLDLRLQVFEATSDLSYVLPVFRQVAGQGTDEADFGLGTPQTDHEKLEELHQNLVDADWSWAKAGGADSLVAIADSKARVLYASANPAAWGASVASLPAVASALKGGRSVGSMVVDGRDPTLVATGIVPAGGQPGLYVLLARATLFSGKPGAVFLQGIPATTLLRDVALQDAGTSMALLTRADTRVLSDQRALGRLPAPVLAGAMNLASGEASEVMADGVPWLVQRQPLRGLGDGEVIADVVVARNLDVGLRVLLEASQALVGVAAVLLALAMILAAVLSRRLSRPIVELEQAAGRVAAGQLDVQVAVRSHDEIGRLGKAFNRMLEGLRDRDRIKSTFRRYLAPDVVDYLLEHPEAQNPGGDRRELTVMFTDLARFTSFAESNPPEKVVEVLNTCLTELAGAIAATGGTLDKFIGDNVMGFFGAPVPRPDHAARACRAALAQLRALDALAPRWREGNWPALDMRCGINTGDMIVGTIGGGQGQDYTVIGDAVNLAARLEGACKVYGTRILVSESTWQAVAGEFEGREIDQVRVVGRATPVRIYELVAEAGTLTAARRTCLQAYGAGLDACRQRDYVAATGAFDRALEADPGDRPSQILRQRARQWQLAPPAGDWSGVWTLDEK